MTRKKIVIADNFEYDIKELRKALIVAGYEVRVAQNGGEVMALLESFSPDLILLEVRLPELNLSEIISLIKNEQKDRTIPFVLSGSPRTVDDRVNLLEMEIDEFLLKPFDIEEAIARIEILLREAEQVEPEEPVAIRGFSGSLAEMSLVDLLQTLEVGKKSGVIRMNKAGAEGRVFVTDGEVLDAQLGTLEPKKALLRLFTWTDGQFAVDMQKHEGPKQIFETTQELISEGITRLYRWKQLTAELPSLHSVIIASDAQPDQTIKKDERQVFELLNGSKRLIDVIEESTFDDIKSLRLLKSLYEKGYIREAPDLQDKPRPQVLEHFSKRGAKNGHSEDGNQLVEAFSSMLNKSNNARLEALERRKQDRRRGDRRRQERRSGFGARQRKIYLNKSELMIVKEKLLSDINSLARTPGSHENR